MVRQKASDGPPQIVARRLDGTRDHFTEKHIRAVLNELGSLKSEARGLRSEVRKLREDVRRLREEPPPEDPLMTSDQVAQKLQISIRTLRTITGSGELPCLRIRGSVRYDRPIVDAYIARCAREGRCQ